MQSDTRSLGAEKFSVVVLWVCVTDDKNAIFPCNRLHKEEKNMAAKSSWWMKIIKTLFLLWLLVTVGFLIFAWNTGVWNAIFPSSEHDTQRPWMPTELGSPAILVFSKTNGFRHIEGIEGGLEAFEELAVGHNWDMMASENGAIFNTEDLSRFEVVVFLNASGDMLSVEQEQAFQTWLESGGGWVGVHAAGDGSHSTWQWYMDNLIGADFTAHIMGPQFQRANVVMESPDHPVVKNVPNIWAHVEEWYSWERSPRAKGFTVLASLDEDSYSPVQNFLGQENDLRMGDHPVIWSNCVGQGRSVYFAMGHQREAFDSTEFRTLLADAVSWTMGLEEGGCELAPTH